MQIHFLRNATFLLHIGPARILVDPMLSAPHTLPSYTLFRKPVKRNPLVPLPNIAAGALLHINAGLITHFRRGHSDHLDAAGARILSKSSVPVYCSEGDAVALRKRGIKAQALQVAQENTFLGGYIMPIKTAHGYGWIAKLMGPGVGYYIDVPGEPSLYISGDTVLTDEVRTVLTDLKPDVTIVAAGGAQLDVGGPLLMNMDDLMTFIDLSPNRVIAMHMEALNHCWITRDYLRAMAQLYGLDHKLIVPEDGDCLSFELPTGSHDSTQYPHQYEVR